MRLHSSWFCYPNEYKHTILYTLHVKYISNSLFIYIYIYTHTISHHYGSIVYPNNILFRMSLREYQKNHAPRRSIRVIHIFINQSPAAGVTNMAIEDLSIEDIMLKNEFKRSLESDSKAKFMISWPFPYVYMICLLTMAICPFSAQITRSWSWNPYTGNINHGLMTPQLRAWHHRQKLRGNQNSPWFLRNPVVTSVTCFVFIQTSSDGRWTWWLHRPEAPIGWEHNLCLGPHRSLRWTWTLRGFQPAESGFYPKYGGNWTSTIYRWFSH